MDRRRRPRTARSGPADPDGAPPQRSHREVLNDARRRIERALAAADAAEDLAEAAQAVLTAAEAEGSDLDRPGFVTLRAALARYRGARGT